MDALDLKVQAVKDAIAPNHPYFHPLAPLQVEVERIENEIAAAGRGEKAALNARLVTPKAQFDVARKKLVDAIKGRHKQVARAVKDLGKLKEERDAREQEVKLTAERELTHLVETRVDLLRILQTPSEAVKYFYVAERAEITENEYNLNMPRYVDTFTEKPSFRTSDVLVRIDEVLQKKGGLLARSKGSRGSKDMRKEMIRIYKELLPSGWKEARLRHPVTHIS